MCQIGKNTYNFNLISLNQNMESKKPKQKQEKFAFRFDPTTNSENGILFRYLRKFNHSSPSTKEKIG